MASNTYGLSTDLMVLMGFESSGRLVGTISTYPGTYKVPGSRAMAKNRFGTFIWKILYENLDLKGEGYRGRPPSPAPVSPL